MGGNGEFSTQKMDMGGNGEFSKKIRIWMDMDLAKWSGTGVDWVSKFCPVKGSRKHFSHHRVKTKGGGG